MRKFLLLYILIWNVSYAEEVPEYLEGATYTITLKNGKKHTYSSKEMKLVKRQQEKKEAPKPKVIEKIKEVEVIVKEPTPTYKPFSIGLLVGQGPNRLKVKRKEYGAEIKVNESIIGGLSLGWQFHPRWQVRGEFLSNETMLLGAEWKFGPDKN